MSLTWVKGLTLNLDELRKLVAIDNTIPEKFDPTFMANEAMLNERVEAFKKITEADFFAVIYDGPEIVGFHVLRGKPPIAHIWTLWIHPGYRGRGLAKELKAKGIKWAREKGYSYIQTGVNTANKRMNEINLQNGFEPFSTIYRLKI